MLYRFEERNPTDSAYLWEFAALDPKQHWCWGNEDPQSLHYLKTNFLVNALHYCFEKNTGIHIIHLSVLVTTMTI